VLAQDSLDLIDALKKLGVEIKQTDKIIQVDASSIWNKKFNKTKIHIGEGATTLRFLALLLVQLHGEFELILGESLKQRPQDELIHLFPTQISLHEHFMRIQSQGSITLPNPLLIDCARSTQFASAVVLNFSMLQTKLVFQNLQGSHNYLQLSQQMLQEFKQGKLEWSCPLDWSSAAFAIAYGLLVGESHLEIAPDPYQADFAIMELLKLIGADFSFDNSHLIVKSSKQLSAFHFDFDACPDLFPVACFIASFCKGTSQLRGLSRLQFKESDRLCEMQKMLTHFGIQWSTHNQVLMIEGGPERIIPAVEAKFADDHRIVMVQALFLLRASHQTLLTNDGCIKKSFPNFMQQIS
jgi:3-phosphoshikimate 1-carboxyvinyltransferase